MGNHDDNTVRFTISAVEHETGLSKDTLRIWERRYGFPAPARDQFGDRLYPQAQVDRLRLIRRLIDRGYRPGRIITEPPASLLALCGQSSGPDLPAPADRVGALLQLVRTRQLAGLRAALRLRVQEQGLRRFIQELAAPLGAAVGTARLRGELAGFDQHLYAEAMQDVLRRSIGEARSGEVRPPRVLLATPPGEAHGLELLMAEAILTLDGAECLPCGVQLPAGEIGAAAAACRAEAVLLSFSSAFPRQRAGDTLSGIVALLPPGVALWAVGDGLAGARRMPAQLTVVAEVGALAATVTAWRAQSGRA